MSKIMYAVYRTKRLGGIHNMPFGIFEKREWADAYMADHCPSWMKDKYWISRVVVNKTGQTAYDITEHIGYKVK